MKKAFKCFGTIIILVTITLLAAACGGGAGGGTGGGTTDPCASGHSWSGGNGFCAVCDVIEEMVWIGAGTFIMGSNDAADWNAQPAHSVTLTSGFYMGKYQVTQEQYEAVMGVNPSYFQGTSRLPETGEIQERRPVEQVSWYDAIVFCNKLSIKEGLTPAYRISGSTNPADWGTVTTNYNTAWDAVEIVSGSNGYRLPTEAQWEYACRAGTTTAWYCAMESELVNYAWYSANSGSKTHGVGKRTENAWGLYDMNGNVMEWCWDWWASYSSGAETDPAGPAVGSNRMIRGGGWDYPAANLRSAFRYNFYPYIPSYYVGFRLIRSF
jgi:formylglycine-generating enzyme required for sulfatase activity